MWDVKFSPKSEKELLKLPTASRILDKLKEASTDPPRYFERLRGRTDYKLRIGDYRVIADLFFAEMRIEVTKVGHRKHIYENIGRE